MTPTSTDLSRDLFGAPPSRTAVLSDCLTYRYRLERQFERPGHTAVVVMVNPSTADHEADDHTIRKLMGFGGRLGWGRLLVGNLFAFRATDVGLLGVPRDPVGPENDRHLADMLGEADLCVFAWGASNKLPQRLRHRWRRVYEIAVGVGRTPLCWGTAADGHPLHPLMLGYDRPLVEWRKP